MSVRNTPARLRPLSSLLLGVALLSACGPSGIANLQQDLTRAATQQLQRSLSGHYTQELGRGVGFAVNELARPGGYLDNPLVKILLPPPLGIAVGVARDLSANPQAAVVETLLNRAAEQVIPGAAPVLQTALAQLTPHEAQGLLEGHATAGTDYLKTKTSAQLRETLAPQMLNQLTGNGALSAYAGLLAAATPATAPPSAASAPAADAAALNAYVTDKTIDGMFKLLGERETRLRADLDAATGGLLPSGRSVNTAAPMTTPAEATPVEATPVEVAPAEAAPAEAAPAEAAPTEAAPTEAAPVEAVPVEAVPVEAVPVEAVPVEAVPVEAAPAEAAPAEAAPAEVAPAETAPAEAAPVEAAPAAAAPAESALQVTPGTAAKASSETAPAKPVAQDAAETATPDTEATTETAVDSLPVPPLDPNFTGPLAPASP